MPFITLRVIYELLEHFSAKLSWELLFNYVFKLHFNLSILVFLMGELINFFTFFQSFIIYFKISCVILNLIFVRLPFFLVYFHVFKFFSVFLNLSLNF
jgi:hypothetical protein